MRGIELAQPRRRAAATADRPRDRRRSCSSPTWMRPPRKVPVVSTTARAPNRMPVAVTTAGHATVRRSAGRPLPAGTLDRPGCDFHRSAGSPARYSWRSACARVARTAGPLLALSVRNWMPAAIGGARHHAAQRIDLAHQVALADAADGRIAAHRADGFDALRQQQRARAAARRGQRGFDAGMSAADHDDIPGMLSAHAVHSTARCGLALPEW